MTPDRKPIVGPVASPRGLIQANGYSGRGFALAPLVAEARFRVDTARRVVRGRVDEARTIATFLAPWSD